MLIWYKTTFDNDESQYHKHVELYRKFNYYFMAESSRCDMALMKNSNKTESQEYYVVITPEINIEHFLKKYLFESCEPPQIDEITLLIGASGAAKRLLS